jgi:DNA polymerase I-like protein with 3'-5' exonuclease and polymerase domains
MPIPWHDSLLAHHSYASHLPQGLSQVVSEYLDSGPWKIRFGRQGASKDEPENMSPEDLVRYNAADVHLTARAWRSIQADPAFRKERAVYEHDLCLGQLCADLHATGMAIDVARKVEIAQKLGEERDRYLTKMRAVIATRAPVQAREFNPARLESVRYAIFTLLRVKAIKRTATGLPYTGKELIENLRGDDTPTGQFAEALSKWRECGKIKRTYLDVTDELTWLEADVPRVHFSWGPRESRRGTQTSGGGHTVSGRLASRIQSAPKYNPRNTPDRVREVYWAPKGKRLVYFDVKQGEPRVAAYLSGDPNMIRICEGGDVHAGNAAIMFPDIAAKGWLSDPEAKKDPARGKPCRDLAKNMGLAINYFAEAERVYSYLLANRFDSSGRPLYGAISLLSVQAIISKIRFAFRKYVQFVERNLTEVKRTGHMRSPVLGRVRCLGWFPKIQDVANAPIQSCLADVMNLRTLMLQGYPAFRAWVQKYPEIAEKIGLPKKWLKLPKSAQLILQHHDSCTYEVDAADAKDALAVLEETWKPVIHLTGELVLPIDLKEGERWSDF